MTTGDGGLSTHTHTMTRNATKTDARTIPAHNHPDNPLLVTQSAIDAAIAAHVAQYHPIVVPPPVITPPPTTRRFPLPVTTQTVVVPSTIDATGTSDVSSAIQSWLGTCPNGSILMFPAGAKYRMASAGISLENRNNLIFTTDHAAPAEIRTEGWGTLNSQFVLGYYHNPNSHITIQNLILRGNNPDGATVNAFHSGKENGMALLVYGHQSYIEFDNVQAFDEWGHGMYISGAYGNGVSPSFIWGHDNQFTRMGVMGIALASLTDGWFERNAITDTAIYPVDFEDGQAGEPMQRVYVGHNTINRWGWNSYYTGHAIDANGSTGMVWDTIGIDANTFTGGFQSVPQNGQAGLISFMGGDTKNHLSITDNRGITGYPDLTVRYANAPGAIVTGNTP